MARLGLFRWAFAGLAITLAGCGQSAAPVSTSAPASTSASAVAKAPASASPSAKPSGPAPVAASVAASAGASAAAKTGRTQLKAAYVPVVAFLALYRAVDKGYFADEGIDLDLQVVQSASNAMAFLGSGQIDAAFGNIGDSFFNALGRNVNVKLVAGLTYSPHDPKQTTSAPVIVRKELADNGTIKGPADLKGRKVAVNTTGGIQEYLLAYALQPAGLTTKDVEVTPLAFPDMPVALKNGAVDAGSPAEPFLSASLEQGFATMLVPNPKPDALITSLLYGSNLLAPDKEPLARGMLKALARASNELQTRDQVLSAENVGIWAKWSKASEDAIRKQVVNVYAPDLVLDVASVVDQEQVLLKAGRLEIKEPLPESALFDSRFVKRR